MFRAGRAFALAAAAVLVLTTACREEKPAAAPPQAQPPAAPSGAAFEAEAAYRHALALCALGPRPSGSPAYAAQADYIERTLSAAGWSVTRDSFTPPPPAPQTLRMLNLRARRGENDAPRPILLSCHIDTKRIEGFIGADDGASGAGVLLELARALAHQPELAAQVELIFLDGEESFAPSMSRRDGLYGSRYDVARRGQDGLPRFQINLDMVGGRDTRIAVPAPDSSDAMLRRYARAIAAAGLSPQRWSLTERSYLDDHLPYLEAGVDSLNLIADFSGSDWWHTPRDSAERLSPRLMGECARLLLQLLPELCRELVRTQDIGNRKVPGHR
ncbi:MAG: M28 family peptidase [Akkermansia sp.]